MNEIVKEYAAGLFALAEEEGVAEQILGEGHALAPLFDREYARLLINPDLPKERRIALVGEALDGRAHPHLANFAKLLTERGLATEIAACFAEYERLWCEANGVVRVRCESAVELTEAEREKLHFKLEAHIGKIVEIEYFVVPKLVGGIRLLYDGHRIDETVRKKLLDIGSRLSRTIV